MMYLKLIIINNYINYIFYNLKLIVYTRNKYSEIYK